MVDNGFLCFNDLFDFLTGTYFSKALRKHLLCFPFLCLWNWLPSTLEFIHVILDHLVLFLKFLAYFLIGAYSLCKPHLFPLKTYLWDHIHLKAFSSLAFLSFEEGFFPKSVLHFYAVIFQLGILIYQVNTPCLLDSYTNKLWGVPFLQ